MSIALWSDVSRVTAIFSARRYRQDVVTDVDGGFRGDGLGALPSAANSRSASAGRFSGAMACNRSKRYGVAEMSERARATAGGPLADLYRCWSPTYDVFIGDYLRPLHTRAGDERTH
jgi:hypothetical protein